MKKRLAFLLSLMLLAGCTKQTANSSSTTNTSTASTNENSGGCAAFAECESSEDEAKLYEDLLAAQNTPFEKIDTDTILFHFNNNFENSLEEISINSSEKPENCVFGNLT